MYDRMSFCFIFLVYLLKRILEMILFPREIYRRRIDGNALSMHTFKVNEEPALNFELCKHNGPPCKAFVQL
jgi:hypothetical protein